jgi:UDP-glucuronate 4-epimerase
MQRTATPLTSVRFRSQPPFMKVLITGSSGFIGFHLSKKLINMGFSVYGVDNMNHYYDVELKKARLSILNENNSFFFENEDITNISNCYPDIEFDLIINLAAQAGVRLPVDKYKNYISSNIDGFLNVMNFALLRGCKKVIYASSSSVYGDAKIPFSEKDNAFKPKSFYGYSKLLNEKIANEFYQNHDISSIGLRFFTVYGEYGRPDMAYFSFLTSILNDKPITLFNDGCLARDMTYIDDILAGIESSISLISKEKMVKIFNLGNSLPIKTINLVRKLEKLANRKAKINYEHIVDETIQTHACLLESQKFLDYNPKVKFDEGLEAFYNWYIKYYVK